MDVYLQACQYIDWQEESVRAQARRLRGNSQDVFAISQACFEFVRDEIKHSWESQTGPVTVSASSVLRHRTGFCYAKSHLLAALLRANHIPAAICYQRLRIGGSSDFCLHALNAVQLPDYGWYRVDARGNNEVIDAQFTPPVEKLAYELFDLGEFFVQGLYEAPHKAVIELLTTSKTIEEVDQRLAETDTMGEKADVR